MPTPPAPPGSQRLDAGVHSLSRSSTWQLITLVKFKLGSEQTSWAIPCARSYEGLAWELAPVQSQELDTKQVVIGSCTTNACDVTVPTDPGFYYMLTTTELQSHYAAATSTSSQGVATTIDAAGWYDRVASNLLLQATNGPTPKELYNLSFALQESAQGAIANAPAALTEWVHTQLALRPTLHRAYLRARINPRVEAVGRTGSPRGACDIGSRWNRAALHQRDNGKSIVLSTVSAGGASVVAMYVGGVLRTEVDLNALPKVCSQATCAPFQLDTTYYLCIYNKLSADVSYVGRQLEVGTGCQANPTSSTKYDVTGLQYMLNPPLSFTHLQPPSYASDNSPIGLLDLGPQDATLVPMDTPSTWPTKVPVGAVFFEPATSAGCNPQPKCADGSAASSFCACGLAYVRNNNADLCFHADCVTPGGTGCGTRSNAVGQRCCGGHLTTDAITCADHSSVGCLASSSPPPSNYSIPATGTDASLDTFACETAVRMGAAAMGLPVTRKGVYVNSYSNRPSGCIYYNFSSDTYPDYYGALLNTWAPGPTDTPQSHSKSRAVCVMQTPASGEAWAEADPAPASKYMATDVRLLNELHVTCPLTHRQQVSPETYMRQGGVYYLNDPRLVMLTNTPESPAAENVLEPKSPDSCPNVRASTKS